jgi:hypothetical protein
MGSFGLLQFGENPAVAGVPAHPAEFIFAGEPGSLKRRDQLLFRKRFQFELTQVPGFNAAKSESLFFKIPAVDRFHCKAFSFNGQALFSSAEWRFAKKRPRAHHFIQDHPYIEVHPAGLVLVDDIPGFHRFIRRLLQLQKCDSILA